MSVSYLVERDMLHLRTLFEIHSYVMKAHNECQQPTRKQTGGKQRNWNQMNQTGFVCLLALYCSNSFPSRCCMWMVALNS